MPREDFGVLHECENGSAWVTRVLEVACADLPRSEAFKAGKIANQGQAVVDEGL